MRWPRLLVRKDRDPGWVPLRDNHPGLLRLLSAGLAGTAVAAGLTATTADPPAGRAVVVTVRPVPAGAVLRGSDLRLAARTPAELPDGALSQVGSLVGRVASAPLASGEVVTDGRVVGPGLLVGRPAGEVLTPVRLADPGAAQLLRPGQRVDVLVAVEGAAAARTVTRGATVMMARPNVSAAGSIVGSKDFGGGGLLDEPADGGGLVLLAVPLGSAAALVQASAAGPLSVIIH
jgi:pilus assembly protein CpaB